MPCTKQKATATSRAYEHRQDCDTSRGLQVAQEHGAERVAYESDACVLEELSVVVP
jgi:hypothetical protein